MDNAGEIPGILFMRIGLTLLPFISFIPLTVITADKLGAKFSF